MERISIKDTVQKINETVRVCGWVNSTRRMGKIIFFDLRDRSGVLQVVCDPKTIGDDGMAIAKSLRPEFVVEVIAKINKRPDNQVNKNIITGTIEASAQKIVILNESKTPPFEIENENLQAREELRLQYRYLDLRHERMKKNIVLRHKVIQFIRDWLCAKDFLEIETPLLTKGTPEGAREYAVPSRLYKGKFYVLPQSPQQFKQLLMVAGIERYFQIARCFRDEDTRGDRQPEFTQLDMEMSFVEREDIMQLIESLMIDLMRAVAPEKKIAQTPFSRISYKEAMEKYGTDRPDLRKDKNNPNELAFCWVVDFPVFVKDKETGKLTFSHNPFTASKSEDETSLLKGERLEELISQQYDIVLNGYEIGGGGIRIHKADVLRKVFEILGHSKEEIEERFGHMLEAFQYGAPPHGGIAWGLDRLIMLLANEPNIREVIPFPKTADAKDLMMGAPAELTEKQLKELHLKNEL
ncbi:MAG: aspartate--tRNA ligase [Parcubacteria group bacterium]|nr:aspartate--tRNA ligase [Parcubacteria group bacterium]